MTADDARKMTASELLDAYTDSMQDGYLEECNTLRAELARRLDAGESASSAAEMLTNALQVARKMIDNKWEQHPEFAEQNKMWNLSIATIDAALAAWGEVAGEKGRGT